MQNIDKLDQDLLVKNEKYYIENLLWIKSKESGLTRFKFNEPQNIIWQKILETREQKKLQRYIIAKARQEGVSTEVQGITFANVTTKPARRGYVIAHKLPASVYLFNMSRLFYKMLPPKFRPICRPPSKTEFDFSNPDPMSPEVGMLSSFCVGTAASLTEGMSQTIHYLHASEFAEWIKPADVWGVISPAIPDTLDTIVFIESTGKLWGDDFHTMYMDAKDGKNDFINIFLPWNIMSEYSRTAPEDFKLSSEEEKLKRTHNLTNDQVYWRRQTLATKYKGDVNKFRRFFPIVEEECFIMSGLAVFDEDTVLEYLKNCTPAKERGIFIWKDKPVFENRHGGYVDIWKQPDKDKHYIVSCDASAGYRGGDDAAVNVLCVEDFSQDAIAYGNFEPKTMAFLLRDIATHYNNALLVVEANAPGLAVITVLKEIYPHLYQRQVVPDAIGKATEPKVGWFTGNRTRPLLFSTLNEILNEKELILRDRDTVLEFRHFYLDQNLNPTAKAKMPTHKCFALMIGIMGYLQFLGCRYPSEVKEIAQNVVNPKIFDDDKEGRAARLEEKILAAEAMGMSLGEYETHVGEETEVPLDVALGSDLEPI